MKDEQNEKSPSGRPKETLKSYGHPHDIEDPTPDLGEEAQDSYDPPEDMWDRMEDLFDTIDDMRVELFIVKEVRNWLTDRPCGAVKRLRRLNQLPHLEREVNCCYISRVERARKRFWEVVRRCLNVILPEPPNDQPQGQNRGGYTLTKYCKEVLQLDHLINRLCRAFMTVEDLEKRRIQGIKEACKWRNFLEKAEKRWAGIIQGASLFTLEWKVVRDDKREQTVYTVGDWVSDLDALILGRELLAETRPEMRTLAGLADRIAALPDTFNTKDETVNLEQVKRETPRWLPEYTKEETKLVWKKMLVDYVIKKEQQYTAPRMTPRSEIQTSIAIDDKDQAVVMLE